MSRIPYGLPKAVRQRVRRADNFGVYRARSPEFMRSAPEFAADPIGTPVDPDALVAARAAGASSEDIHRRAYADESRRTGRWTCGFREPGWPEA